MNYRVKFLLIICFFRSYITLPNLSASALNVIPTTPLQSGQNKFFEIEILNAPVFSTPTISYTLTENLKFGFGYAGVFTWSGEYSFSGHREHSWFVRSVSLGLWHPTLDVGYRWRFDRWNLGLNIVGLRGPDPIHGPDSLVIPAISIGFRI